MIFIVEGPNNSGKTTFIKKWKEFDPEINVVFPIYVGKPETKNLDEFYKLQDEKLLEIARLNFSEPNRVHVMDRFFLSEYVYSELKGKSVRPVWLLKRTKKLFQLGPVVIFMNPLFEILLSRMKNSPDDGYVTQKEILAEKNLYEDLIDCLPFKVITIADSYSNLVFMTISKMIENEWSLKK